MTESGQMRIESLGIEEKMIEDRVNSIRVFNRANHAIQSLVEI